MADLLQELGVDPKQNQNNDLLSELGISPDTPVLPPQTLLDQQSGRVIEKPTYMNADEAIYHDKVSNQGQKPQDFFGYVPSKSDSVFDLLSYALKYQSEEVLPVIASEMRDTITAPFRGVATEAQSIPATVGASTRMQFADAYKDQLTKQRPTAYEALMQGTGTGTTPSSFLSPFNLLERAGRAWANTDRVFKGEAEQEKSLIRNERLIQAAERIAANNQKWRETTKLAQTDNAVEKVLFDIGSTGSTTLAAIGVSALTRDPKAAMLMMGGIQKSSLYLEGRDKLSLDENARVSALGGTIEAGLEMVGFDKLMSAITSDLKIGKVVEAMAVEAVQEFFQTGAEETLTQTTGVREVDILGGFKDALYAGLLGAFAGGGSTYVYNKLLETKVKPREADLLMSKLNENMPKFEDRLAEILENEAGKFDISDPVVKKTAELFNKFQQGDVVDIKAELDGIKELTDSDRAQILEAIGERGGNDIKNATYRAMKGRVRTITSELESIDNEWSALEDAAMQSRASEVADLQAQAAALQEERTQRIAAKKPLVAIDKKIAKINQSLLEIEQQAQDIDVEDLLARRNELESELADIMTAKTTDQELLSVRKMMQEDVTLKGSAVVNLGINSSKARLSAAQEAIKKLPKNVRKEVASVQMVISDMVRQSGLPAQQRNKFEATIRNLQTTERAINALPRIAAKIDREVMKLQRGKLNTEITKVINKMKPEKRGARPVGKTNDADIQEIFDVLKRADKMTPDEASKKLAENIMKETQGQSEQATLYENQLLYLKLGKTGGNEAADLLLDLNNLQKGAKSAAKSAAQKRRDAVNEVRARILDLVLKGQDIEDFDEKAFRNRVTKKVNQASSLNMAVMHSWEGVIDIPFGKDRALSDYLINRVGESLMDERALYTRYTDKMLSLMGSVYRLKNGKAITNKMLQDEVEVNLGTFQRDGDKKARPWKLTRSQMRTLYMQLKNEKLRETLTAPIKKTSDGQMGNGITQDMIDRLERELDVDDKVMAEKTLEFYKEMYAEVNEVYKRMYGINLPFEKFYSPVVREYERDLVDSQDFLTGLNEQVAAGLPSFTKNRMNTFRKIEEKSDILELGRYIRGASHFVAMAETNKDLNEIFSNTEVSKALEKTWGGVYNEIVKAYIEDFTRGYTKSATLAAKWFERFNVNVSKALINGKPNAFIKQLTGFVGYAAEMPAADFAKGVADFAVNFNEAIDILSKSPLMKNRHGDVNIEMVRSGLQKMIDKNKLSRANAKLDDFFAYPTVLGDRSAIYVGGWAVYKYHKDTLGKSHEEAIKAFERATDNSQQPTRLDKRSRAQLVSNPIARGAMMFISHPLQLLRVEAKAFRQMVRGQMSKAEATKIILTHHIIGPVLFQLAANAFNADDEDDDGALLRAAILGPANSYPLLGGFATAFLANLWDIDYSKNLNASGVELSLRQVYDIMTKMQEDGFEGIELKDFIMAVSLVTGKPLQSVFNSTEGVGDISEGEEYKGALRAIGYTEKTAEKASD
jgi:hypothetical protein